ncbi:hypothetical protein LPJ61_001764 [Coemansia biformis]|uniref:RRM domain-containing protein n=1 Tax=Coemansia biformis TaxID=1286918 RepID=A0A9W7YEA5_9FUNG|nr:hypothetical protein LPJ61_001764 [Coemansia biformis]
MSSYQPGDHHEPYAAGGMPPMQFGHGMPGPAHFGPYGGGGGPAPARMPPPPPHMVHMPYGPPPAKMPRIRHPNRPPCTTPSKTLYIRNLNEKTKIPALTAALRALFEMYGEIVEIRARHSIRMRGQAFITFKSQDDAAKAQGEVQGFVLFGKPMFIEFSRMPSETSVAGEGGDVAAFKQERAEAKLRREQEAQERLAQAPPPAMPAPPQDDVPNKILFLQGLPPGVDVGDIERTFAEHPGFVEVRWVAVKPDVAFVEYESEMHAGMARAALGSQWAAGGGDDDVPPASISFARH